MCNIEWQWHYKVQGEEFDLKELNLIRSNISNIKNCQNTGNIIDLNKLKYSKRNDIDLNRFLVILSGPRDSADLLSNFSSWAGCMMLNNRFYLIKALDKNNSIPLSLNREQNASSLTNDDRDRQYWKRNRFKKILRGLFSPLRKKTEEQHTDNKFNFTRKMYMETLVVLDKSFIEFYKYWNLENYVFTIFNMVNAAFRDNSFGAYLEVVIVRIKELEREDDQMNIALNSNPTEILEIFKAWANRINPMYELHPQHHDMAILITRLNICYVEDQRFCFVGITSVGSCCDPANAAMVVRDSGINLGHTLARLIGHTMGIVPESLNTSWNCGEDRMYAVNSVLITKTAKTKMRKWTRLSREYLRSWSETEQALCLYDEPYNLPSSLSSDLPGVAYGVTQQCYGLYGAGSTECPNGSIECDNLRCWLPKISSCVDSHLPAADGTECGSHRWCYSGKCINKGILDDSVDGGWSEWNDWTPCTRSCGGGITKSYRNCDNPRPGGGDSCTGQRIRYHVCNDQPCPYTTPSFRAVQCAQFNDWIYPETNRKNLWMDTVFNYDDPCALMCTNEEGQSVILKRSVEDGTECLSSYRGICVGGFCKTIPCDNIIGSKAVEDACGVCHGDGTTCSLRTGRRRFQKKKYLQHLCFVPKSTINVLVEETSSTNAKIIVIDHNKNIFFGRKLGLANMYNMTFWLGMMKPKQKILKIKGPTARRLRILVAAREEVTMRYSIATPARNKRLGQTTWRFLQCGECSETCGQGVQICEAQCTSSQSGMIEDIHCDSEEKPPPKSRICDLQPCVPTSRWQLGEWSGCDCEVNPVDDDERSVDCVRTTRWVDAIVDDNLCTHPKPKSRRKCICPQKIPSDVIEPVPTKRAQRHKSKTGNNLNHDHQNKSIIKKENFGTTLLSYEDCSYLNPSARKFKYSEQKSYARLTDIQGGIV